LAWLIAILGVILGSIAVIGPFLPGDWTNSETGESISRHEAWKRGIATETIMFGFCLIFIGICIFRRINFVRYFIPLMLLMAAGYFYFTPDTSSKFDLCGALVWAVISSWYFFKKPSIVAYFTKLTEQVVAPDG